MIILFYILESLESLDLNIRHQLDFHSTALGGSSEDCADSVHNNHTDSDEQSEERQLANNYSNGRRW